MLYSKSNSLGKLFAKLYINYRYSIFPKIKHLRGTTRIAHALEKLSWIGLETTSKSHNFMEEDWKNLIILDACRHDLYQEVNGETDYRFSVGGASREYIENTFSNQNYLDTVYITANPYFFPKLFQETTGKKPEEVFHEVFHLYKDEWNEENQTVMPVKVVEKALLAEKLFPEKKKIIHFMQPHYPFLGSEWEADGFQNALEGEDSQNVWVKTMIKELDPAKVKRAYRNNLEQVMPHAEKLVEELQGKTTITADHGNLIGENGLYGHPEKCRAIGLRKVPWDEREPVSKTSKNKEENTE